MKARILLADDHAVVADGLRAILDPHHTVVGVAADGRALVEQALKIRPDVILTDISMPLLNGLDAVRQLKAAKLRSKVIFLTGSHDVGLATQAFRAGASGYVLKASAADEVVNAIAEVLQGRTYITPRIADEVLQQLMSGDSKTDNPADSLSPREREVLQLLAEGRSAKEIAAVMDVSPRTVEFHKSNIMDKTNLRTTAKLARFAAKHGLVED